MDLHKKNGEQITSWEEWERPKKEYQWQEGRSAMELAKAWFRSANPTPPEEICKVIALKFGNDIEFVKAIPELVTSLPERGEGRNHDLSCLCNIDGKQVTICIEGKADESFGEYKIAEYYQKMLEKRETGKSTRAPERIEKLISMLPIKCQDVNTCKVANNGYQLLTALTGTAIQARKDESDFAIFLVHEFHTVKTNQIKIQANAEDFSTYVKTVHGNRELDCSAGLLNGPVLVNGIECYIGRVIA